MAALLLIVSTAECFVSAGGYICGFKYYWDHVVLTGACIRPCAVVTVVKKNFSTATIALILLGVMQAKAEPLPPLGTTQYTYKLSLLIDFKKREKILKANGEEPSVFDKALSKFSSAIHAADVVDTVERKANQLKITSVTSPVGALSVLVADKKYKRQSISAPENGAYRTTFYYEERGDGPRTTSVLDYKKQSAIFYTGSKVDSTEKLSGDTQDMLSVLYEGVGRKKTVADFWINSSKGLQKMQFTPAEMWDIPVGAQKLKARRYAKRVDKNDTATFEIWIDEASKMPVRYQIGLAENYGATILVELQGVK